MQAGVVVFLGLFAVSASAFAWGCSNDDSSTFDLPDSGAADAGPCKIDPTTGSIGDCTCGTLADYCAGGCLSTLAEANDASAWGSAPNCVTEKSTNICSNAIEFVQHGVDTGSTLYYDGTSGALLAAVDVNNLKEKCWGTIPGGNCDDAWTLAPAFGTFDYDAGVCHPLGDAGL